MAPAAQAPLTVVVLAAGQGTRMRSSTIKLLHPVAGTPMVTRVVEAVQSLEPRRTVVVVGFQADRVREALQPTGCSFATQRRQRGTGHAVLQAASEIGKTRGTLLILNGDLATIRSRSLRRFVTTHRRSGAALSILTAELDDPTGYGRILRGADGNVERIVEHRDASTDERRVREINSGLYCADPTALLPALERLRPANAQGEYYLTDAVEALIRQGKKVAGVIHADADEVVGVNDRRELARASATIYARKAHELQDRGVTLLDASRTWIDPRARIGRDTTIYPDVLIEGPCSIGRGCVIRSGTRITNCRVGNEVEIKDHCVLDSSRLGDRVAVGPFAHVRPETEMAADSKIGNFVELKKTRLGPGSKASHLSYLGDATIGPSCNIGAGTITCNYDGKKKHRTTLERDVFIGSDSQLVAPVRIRKGAYVAAGTTVTSDVPAGSLAVGRSKQRNVRGWVARRRKD